MNKCTVFLAVAIAASSVSAQVTCPSGQRLYCWSTNPGEICMCCYSLTSAGACVHCAPNEVEDPDRNCCLPSSLTSEGRCCFGTITAAGTCCGDRTCSAGENAQNCSRDCPSVCGDGLCIGGENACSCPRDCPVRCGDGCCTAGETAGSCAADCAALCGDGRCSPPEDPVACPQDCDPCYSAEGSGPWILKGSDTLAQVMRQAIRNATADGALKSCGNRCQTLNALLLRGSCSANGAKCSFLKTGMGSAGTTAYLSPPGCGTCIVDANQYCSDGAGDCPTYSPPGEERGQCGPTSELFYAGGGCSVAESHLQAQ